MKTFKILLFFTFLGISMFSGCSEDNNPLNGFDNSGLDSKSKSIFDNIEHSLIWRHEGLKIKAIGERIVSADTDFIVDYDANYNLLVTFDGWTNADTSAYVSKLSILADGNSLCTLTGERYINGHHELYFSNVNAGYIRFYIALWCDDPEFNSNADLNISNIKIYNQ